MLTCNPHSDHAYGTAIAHAMPIQRFVLFCCSLLAQAEGYRAQLQRANSELTSLLRDKSKVGGVGLGWVARQLLGVHWQRGASCCAAEILELSQECC